MLFKNNIVIIAFVNLSLITDSESLLSITIRLINNMSLHVSAKWVVMDVNFSLLTILVQYLLDCAGKIAHIVFDIQWLHLTGGT